MAHQKWEYQFLFERDGETPIQTLNQELDELGDDGWEVVGMVQTLISPTKTEDDSPPGLFAMGMTILLKRSKQY